MKDEEKGGSSLQASLNHLRDHIVAHTKAGAKLLQSYLDLGGSLADFPQYAESFKALGVKPTLRVVEGGKSDTDAPRRRGPKKGAKKVRKPPPKPEKAAKASKGDASAKVLEVLAKAEQPMAVSDVATAAGISGKEASATLKALRDEKKVKATGKARGTRWATK